MTLKPGMYELSEDVINPKGDGRVRHTYWRRPLLKAGQKFVCEFWDDGTGPTDILILRPAGHYGDPMAVAPSQAARDRGARDYDEVREAVLPRLRRIEAENYDDVLFAAKCQYGIGPDSILRKLFNNGLFRLDDVRGAVEDIMTKRTDRCRE